MSDLADGESVEISGSGARPYVLKNVGGVYSCTCPAWRNQSTAIERRTCKHLRKYRGEAAEETRLGSALPARPASASAGEAAAEPPLLLAESWDNLLDLSGWWMSEKLDGVRAYWDGKQFLSRQGNLYHAPDWFIEGLPEMPLDGELWIDRRAFQRTVSIVRRQDKSDHWQSVRYLVFDAPAAAAPFEERLEWLRDGIRSWKNKFLSLHEHTLCQSESHLREELERVEAIGGEGLMLRQPGSLYASGRSATLLKVKRFHDAEAEVVRHEAGKGRHAGRLGALAVRLPNGKEFSVGTGFSDRERESPPPVGSLIRFRYQELSDAGIPRFPSYLGMRSDIIPAIARPVNEGEGESPLPVQSVRARKKSSPSESTAAARSAPAAEISSTNAGMQTTRYFEVVDGSSNKFWGVSLDGSELSTRWGRIGTAGQTKTKSFASPEKARAEYDKLVAEKVSKGYREVFAGSETKAPADLAASAADARPEPVVAAANLAGLEDVLKRAIDESTETDSATPAFRALFKHADEIESLLREEEGQAAAAENEIPSQIHLERTGENLFDNKEAEARLSASIVRAGFRVAGSYTVRELPVVLRAFVRAPNVTAVVFELGAFTWVELSVYYADETKEVWSNVPMHDGIVPPWTTFVADRDADFDRLHALMTAGRSGKAPATIERFDDHFEIEYVRTAEWRASLRSDASVARPVSKAIEEQVLAFANDYAKARRGSSGSATNVVPSGGAILSLPLAEQLEALRACYPLMARVKDASHERAISDLRERLLRRKLPYTDEDIESLASELKRSASDYSGLDKGVLGAIELWCKEHPLSAKARELLRAARQRATAGVFSRDAEKLKGRIDALVGDDEIRLPILSGEVWADAAIADIEQMATAKRAAWTRLIGHCVTATTGKPGAAWLSAAKPLIDTVTTEELHAYANKWFPLIDKPWTTQPRRQFIRDPLALHESNQDILRGLVWCCCQDENAQTIRTLGAMAASAYRKIPQVGARATRVGNACVFGLGSMSHSDAVTQLAILKVKVKFGTAQRFIEQELTKAAERLGLPREELEEMSVPAFGMEEVGLRREEIGDFTAELTVTASGATELRWIKADAAAQKSVPAAVQKEFAEELKELKGAAKEIQKMVPVQKARIDSVCLAVKSWPLAAWRERYLDHPLVGIVARRLIWRFNSDSNQTAGIFLDGQIVGHHDQPIGPFDEGTIVELWHPIDQSLEEVLAWRTWLERHEVQQPFKQAHREVYLLTDAERATRTYSNRFAAHILRQTRLRALASARGWQCPLLGPWDGGDCAQATRRLPQWENIEAQFWINDVGDADTAVDDDAGDSPGVAYVSTDQVRFCATDDREPIALADVPPRLLSEIMRDVDLFVGVASVGNDPTWSDGGPDGRYVDYWTSYSFGELSATANTRRDVLARLVPRLKIADRCTLSDRFLVVRGDKRTYKIHLGSGNILMLPNDQYLCIVPDQSAPRGGTMFLPFEGDSTLSVILSKAFLLADDAKIADPTIVSQIEHRS